MACTPWPYPNIDTGGESPGIDADAYEPFATLEHLDGQRGDTANPAHTP